MTATDSPPSPWWASVSIDELALSEGVVTDFIGEGEMPSPEETMRFARALALQTLCVRSAALPEAIARATALTSSYRAWTSASAVKADRTDPTGWVRRSPSVRQGLELCRSMLPGPLAAAVDGEMQDFVALSQALENANRDSYFLDGTRRPLSVTRTQIPRQPRSGGG